MQEIHRSNSPVVNGVCDPNKSQARHYRKLTIVIAMIIQNSINKKFPKVGFSMIIF